jgi:hypothetical protein
MLKRTSTYVLRFRELCVKKDSPSLIDLIYKPKKLSIHNDTNHGSSTTPNTTISAEDSKISASVKGDGRRGKYKWLDMNAISASMHGKHHH